jgi:hypothetical protein
VASEIILEATGKPSDIRGRFVANRLNAIHSGLPSEIRRSRRRLVASGKSPDQALFDAMRMAIADVYLSETLRSLRETSFAQGSGLGEAGLGMSAGDRQTGCTVAGTASTVAGVVSLIPIYGTIVGAIVGIGSGIAGQSMNCGAEQAQAQQNAAQAQQNLAAAQQTVQQAAAMRAAAEQQAAADQRAGKMRVAAVGAAGVLVLGVGAYFLLS